MNELEKEKSQDELEGLLESLKKKNLISKWTYDDIKTIYSSPCLKHLIEEELRSVYEESERLYEETVRKSYEEAKKKLGDNP